MMTDYEKNPPVEALNPHISCGITNITKKAGNITLHLVKEIDRSYPEYTFRYYWKELRTD
jgi:hypothetical protein